MPRNSAIIIAALAGVVAPLSGCADYLNRYDTVTLAARNTQSYNRLLHTKNPFNPKSDDVNIETDGVRAADVAKVYREGQKPGAAQPSNVTVNVTQ